MGRILLADDSATTRSVVKNILLENGHEIIEAENGLEGYDLYFAEKPDAVILDVTMPIMNGIDCLKKIRKTDDSAKIIMLTSNANKDRIEDAIISGSLAYLSKPVDSKELLRVLDSIL